MIHASRHSKEPRSFGSRMTSREESQAHPSLSRRELNGTVHLQSGDRTFADICPPFKGRRFRDKPEMFIPHVAARMKERRYPSRWT
jgi:hypothetical protein